MPWKRFIGEKFLLGYFSLAPKLILKEFPRAKPEGTSEGGGVYLTIYPELSPDTDII